MKLNGNGIGGLGGLQHLLQGTQKPLPGTGGFVPPQGGQGGGLGGLLGMMGGGLDPRMAMLGALGSQMLGQGGQGGIPPLLSPVGAALFPPKKRQKSMGGVGDAVFALGRGS